MRRWIAIVAGLALSSPSWAAETTVNWGLKTGAEPRTLCVYDTSTAHTCVPVGQLNSTTHGYGNSVTNCDVTAYGADPTGAADSSAAFIACAAKTVNGQLANIYVPAGTYLLRQKVTVSAQCLYGDGKSNTFLHIDQTFNSTATSVIYLTGVWTDAGNTQNGACVHDIAMQFDQPSDQASRAAYKTLAAGCTSGLGGSGCKYPPAIYNDGTPGRMRLYNLRIERSWDSINIQRAIGIMIDNIEEGALNTGLILAAGTDFGYISHWEHWPFGAYTGNIISGVWRDGLNFAASIGEADGTVIEDFRTYEGRIQLTSAFGWGTFISPELDDINATFEVAHVAPASPGLSIIGGYSTGASITATAANNSHCALDFTTTSSDQKISVVGMTVTSGAGGTTPQLGVVCLSGSGETVITGGHITSGRLDLSAYYQNGGQAIVNGVDFGPGGGQPRTAYVVNVNSGQINFSNNAFNTTGQAGSVDGLFINVDGTNLTVIGNSFKGWNFKPPGLLGTYGPNGSKCIVSGASPQTCNGWVGAVTTNSLATAALTSATYVINDTSVIAGAAVKCGIQGYSGTGVAIVTQCVAGAGTITATIYNAHATVALSAAVTIGFTVQ